MVFFPHICFTTVHAYLTSGALDELLPGWSGVWVSTEHVGGLQQQNGGLLDTAQGRRHVLLQYLVLAAVHCLIANLGVILN